MMKHSRLSRSALIRLINGLIFLLLAVGLVWLSFQPAQVEDSRQATIKAALMVCTLAVLYVLQMRLIDKFLVAPLSEADKKILQIEDGVLSAADLNLEPYSMELREMSLSLNKLSRELKHRPGKIVPPEPGATQEQVRFLNQILDTSPNFVFLVDLQSSKILYANQTFMRYLGLTAGELENLTLSIVEGIMHPDDLRAYQERFGRLQSSDEGEVVETELRLRDGKDEWRWFHCRATVFTRSRDGQPLQCLFTSQDITRRRRLEEQLKFLSFHDPLTGLPNRNYFEKEMARIERDRLYPVSVIIIDADDLKETNDSKGHAVGDALLTRIAVALKNVFRATDLIARIGGDEFAILLPRTKEQVAARAVGRLREEMQAHNLQAEIPVNISIGFATADSPERLSHAMELADDRMYQEKFKRDGRGQRKRLQ